MGRQYQYKLILFLLLGFAFYLVSHGGYIYAKATVAQWLIKDAWQQTLTTGNWHPPWSWADTWPVAKLSIKSNDLYVLEGASGRVLAFGPGHLSQTALPGESGNIVIAGHRDTHFRLLADIHTGEILELHTPKGNYRYRVSQIQIVDQNRMDLLQSNNVAMLTLITCYPFNAIQAGTSLRYVVQANQISR